MKFKTIEITMVGLFVALAIISVFVGMIMPGIMIFGTNVPISLLPTVSVLIGAILGKRLGAVTMFVYMLLGLIGLPIFQDGTGGFGHVFGPTFGFIPGFIVASFVSGWIVEQKPSLNRFIFATITSVIPLYLIGILYMWAILTFYVGKATSIWALTIMMGPFFVKDVILSIVAGFLAYEVSRRLHAFRKSSVRA